MGDIGDQLHLHLLALHLFLYGLSHAVPYVFQLFYDLFQIMSGELRVGTAAVIISVADLADAPGQSLHIQSRLRVLPAYQVFCCQKACRC